ncbi:MAG: glutamate--tRNA ligase family protein, partial [Bacteroidia bacterium]|nr:glutamate--tRNA ligase family protein [Bacteroidia bacterium]
DGNGKLSKRDKSGLPMFPLNWYDERTGESYVGYRESGFFPEAFINMLALLGWNPGGNQEILSKEELINLFSFERVHKAGAKFDPEKTKWFNQQHLKSKTNDQLARLLWDKWVNDDHGEMFKLLGNKSRIQESVPNDVSLPDYLRRDKAQFERNISFMSKVCGLMKEKATFPIDIFKEGKYFFVAPQVKEDYDAEVLKKRLNEQTGNFIKEVATAYAGLNSFTAVETEATLKATAEKCGLGAGQVMQLFRVSISGVGGGPALFEMIELLGKEEILTRLQTFIKINSL